MERNFWLALYESDVKYSWKITSNVLFFSFFVTLKYSNTIELEFIKKYIVHVFHPFNAFGNNSD